MAFVVATVTAFSYLELVTKYPQAAGAALYAHKAFGIHFVTFLVAFVVMCSGITSASTASRRVRGQLRRRLRPRLAEQHRLVLCIALAFMALVAAVNFRGVGESVKLNVVLTIIEISGLLLVIFVGLLGVHRAATPTSPASWPSTPPSDKNVFLAVTAATSLAFFAMVGFEDSVNMAEETKDPVRDLPEDAADRPRHRRRHLRARVDRRRRAGAGRRARRGQRHPARRGRHRPARRTARSTRSSPFISMFAVANTALINMLMASRLIYGMASQHVLPPVLGAVHRDPPDAVGGDPLHHRRSPSA